MAENVTAGIHPGSPVLAVMRHRQARDWVEFRLGAFRHFEESDRALVVAGVDGELIDKRSASSDVIGFAGSGSAACCGSSDDPFSVAVLGGCSRDD